MRPTHGHRGAFTTTFDQSTPSVGTGLLDTAAAASTRWDLAVVGGGTAGIVSAKTAARLGASVLLIERDRTGGDCLWTGCVPSKAILAAAHTLNAARDAARFGVGINATEVDFSAVMDRVRAAIARIAPTDSPAALRSAGVQVLHGNAHFSGPSTVVVNGAPIRFGQAILATGAAPAIPPITGLDQAGALTTDTVWDLQQLPARLAILGGGSIGCELGQAFARLGSQVTIIEGAERILPREDGQAAASVAQALADDGVKICTGHRVTEVTAAGTAGGTLHLDDGSIVDYDYLLVAVGRTPRTAHLGLSSANVATNEHGFVTVNRHLRTTNRRIWAAGDLTGYPQFTHVAGVHASTAATNAVLGLRREVSAPAAVPRVTFTQPEVAAVGVATDRYRDRAELKVLYWANDHVDRAVAEGSTNGFTKLVTDRSGRVLGATIVGPRAGESLAELTLAIRQGLKTRHLATTIHPYPTFGDGPWNAAIADVQERLARPAAARLIRALSTLRRWQVR